MTLGACADMAWGAAVRLGHKPRKWQEGRDVHGMKWVTSCRVCGAMVLAESSWIGAMAAGTGIRRRCTAVLASKARRQALAAKRRKG